MSVGIFQNGKYNKVAGNAKDSTAANTTYNNGTSELQANNVQSAIDEVSAKIGQENISQVGNSVTGAINNLNSNLQNNFQFYYKHYTNTSAMTGFVAGKYDYVTIPFPAKTGYTRIFLGAHTNNSELIAVGYYPVDSSNIRVYFYNKSSSSIDASYVNLIGMYVKDELFPE